MQALLYDELKQIVKNTPLIAIDLIMENPEGEILLGWRNNSPAKGFWFVPGGRVLKNEDFSEAFKRIAKTETGLEFMLENAFFLGVYQHIYPNDNFADDPSFGTHYVVIAYRIKLREKILNLPKEQHSDYWWAAIDAILEDPNIHESTKNYFNDLLPFSG